jgi:hypothetical protein
LQIYFIFTRIFARFCKFQKLSQKETATESAKRREPTLTLKPDGLCVYETTKQAAYNFSVSLILISFFMILNFLNKKESKVICKREFEIILLQTQSLSIKPLKGSLVL